MIQNMPEGDGRIQIASGLFEKIIIYLSKYPTRPLCMHIVHHFRITDKTVFMTIHKTAMTDLLRSNRSSQTYQLKKCRLLYDYSARSVFTQVHQYQHVNNYTSIHEVIFRQM